MTEITAKQNVKSTVGGVQFENKVGIFADTVDGTVIKPVLVS